MGIPFPPPAAQPAPAQPAPANAIPESWAFEVLRWASDETKTFLRATGHPSLYVFTANQAAELIPDSQGVEALIEVLDPEDTVQSLMILRHGAWTSYGNARDLLRDDDTYALSLRL